MRNNMDLSVSLLLGAGLRGGWTPAFSQIFPGSSFDSSNNASGCVERRVAMVSVEDYGLIGRNDRGEDEEGMSAQDRERQKLTRFSLA